MNLNKFLKTIVHCSRSGGLSTGEGWDAVTRCGWDELKMAVTTEYKGQVPSIRAEGELWIIVRT